MKKQIDTLTLPEQESNPTECLVQELYANFLKEMEVECQIRVGTLDLRLEDLQQMREGDVLPLHQKVDEPVELILQNRVIARGELWLSEDNYAIKITQIGD